MVIRQKLSKTSSVTENYEFKGSFSYRSPRIATISAREGHIFGKLDPAQYVDEDRWNDPPHKAFANLRLEPESVQAFIKMYGVLFDADVLLQGQEDLELPELDLEDTDGFHETIKDFAHVQELLRRGWVGELLPIIDIEAEIERGFAIETLDIDYGYVLLKTRDLWKLICFLFLLDLSRGALGKCQHPDCPAPFFIPRRRTQKFCELGTCTEYAQRQYALKWWREKGTKLRAKQQSKARRTKR